MSKWLWLSLGLVVIVGMVLASLSSAHPEWQDAIRWADSRRLAWRDDGCPVPYGEPSAGCSRTDYRAAALAAKALAPEQEDLVMTLVASGALPANDLLTATSSAVALLRKGAHREVDVADDQPRFGASANNLVTDVLALRLAFAALQLHARSLAQHDATEAMSLLTDGLAAAADIALAGIGVERIIGQMALKQMIDEINDDLLRRCDGDGIHRLAGFLGLIEGAMPAADDFLERDIVHKITYFHEVQDPVDTEVHPAGFWAAWRHGFSVRSYAIARVCRQFELMRQARELSGAGDTWAARQAALAWFDGQVSKPPFDSFGIPAMTGIERENRIALAAVGQLLQAIAFHRRAIVPELKDPLGAGVMQVEVHGDDAVFRSAEKTLTREAHRGPR